jgi:hypothetical protein
LLTHLSIRRLGLPSLRNTPPVKLHQLLVLSYAQHPSPVQRFPNHAKCEPLIIW